MIALAAVAISSSVVPTEVPCVSVSGAGMSNVDGLYAAEDLPSYVGPVAYHKPGTDFWIYRWHQTFWHLSELKMPLLDEEAFTRPVIYTAMTERSSGGVSPFPPQRGWTGDVMRGYGPAPFPRISKMEDCQVRADGNLKLVQLEFLPGLTSAALSDGQLRHISDQYEIKRTVAVAGMMSMMALLLLASACQICCRRRPRRPRMKFCPAVSSARPIILSGGSLVVTPVALPV